MLKDGQIQITSFSLYKFHRMSFTELQYALILP